MFAEKLRAMGERCRPRDLYDIVNLYRRHDFRPHASIVRSVYVEKCESKGVKVFTLADIEESDYREDLEQQWENMLRHQLPALPPLDSFWNELPAPHLWIAHAALRPCCSARPGCCRDR
ncbi:MAG: nucleotidyl transferase AbiEii/AbiGii toxin family protein [Planctomycetes bacterium]|nr:nucleotidyl transferase AbiEii/AbiGii toxin family protein [Planctomycetota bacterium]